MRHSPTLVAALALSCSAGATVPDISGETQTFVNDYETLSSVDDVFSATTSQVSAWTSGGGVHALQVQFQQPTSGTAWPRAAQTFSPAQSWPSNGSGIAVDVYNPGTTTVNVLVAAYISSSVSVGSTFAVKPGASTVVLPFAGSAWTPAATAYGMWQLPPLYTGATFATTNSYTGSIAAPVIAVRFAMNPSDLATGPVTVQFDNLRVLKPRTVSDWLAGIVDGYGQFTGRTYTGKITQNSDLTGQHSSEHTALLATSDPSGIDSYGGASSYTETATGYFHTYQATNGKRWLIDPDGHYFYSVGANGVLNNRSGATFVTKSTVREPMFTSLPDRADADYGQFFTLGETGTLSGFTTGETYNHFKANLYTEYGGSSTFPWTSTSGSSVSSTYAGEVALRMRKWGLNTIGGFSGLSGDAREWVAMTTPYRAPYTVSVASTLGGSTVNTVQVPGLTPIPDPYDSTFASDMATRAGWAANQKDPAGLVKTKDDPNCVGYFVDNELGWRSPTSTGTDDGECSLAIAVLKQNGTPCKGGLATKMQSYYTTIGALNSSWGTSYADFTALNAPATFTRAYIEARPTMKAALKAFIGDFAGHYFSTIKSALATADPNHLYLGCRFATNTTAEYNFTDDVLAKAGLYCDVVSVNFYGATLPSGLSSKIALCNAPVLISETSVQAIDRDHFSQKLLPWTATQSDRVTAATSLLNSIGADPNVVGFHWYQWNDQAVAGQPWGGENCNDGLVSITDRPYSELIAAIGSFASGVYSTRAAVGVPQPPTGVGNPGSGARAR